MIRTRKEQKAVIAPAMIALGLVLVCGPSAFALRPDLGISQYAHAVWRVRDGFLNGATPQSIAQTPDGYLWLGTEAGLFRFDGIRAVRWQPPPGQQLPSQNIGSLLVSSDGTLWIGTDRGLASWKDRTIVQYKELDGRIAHRPIEDRQGSIWITTGAAATGKWSLCSIVQRRVDCYGEDGGPGAGAIGLYEDRRGHLWVGTSDGVWHWQPGPPAFVPLTRHPNGIQGLSEADDGTLLVSLTGGINRLASGQARLMYPFPPVIEPAQALHLLRDRDGGLWVGTFASGLVHIHRGIIDVFAKPDGLSGDNVTRLFEDREGSIWVVTSEGLDRFRDAPVVSFSTKQGLSNSRAESVLASNDSSIWVATAGALNRLDQSGITVYRDQAWAANVRSMFQDRSGRIWISTQRGVGYLARDQFVPVRGLPGGITRAIVEDSGHVWVVHQASGLFGVSSDAGKIEHIPWAMLNHQDSPTAAAADSRQSGVWLGFGDGRIARVADGQVRTVYSSAEGLGHGTVRDLRLDGAGTLWAATDGGLSRIKDRRVSTLSSRNGLPCDGMQWSLEDDVGFVWVSTTCGLVRIAHAELDRWVAGVARDGSTPPQVRATVFGASDGFAPWTFWTAYSAPAIKASDGRLWFVARDGVGVVDPRHLPINPLSPPVQIEQIIADRTTYDPATAANGHLRLPARTRDLQIDYTALSLAAPEKVRFRYLLENHDADWQDVGGRRQAFYNDLPAGTYRFRVIASNDSGVWNETGTYMDFSIAPAYYQTRWFRAASAVMVLALLWAVYQLRVRQIARQYSVRLDERVNERTRIARELHDTLLQSFQGVLIHFQAATNLLPGRPEEARQRFEHVLEQAARAVTEGRDAVQALREPSAASDDLPRALSVLAEQLVGDAGPDHAATVRVNVEGTPRSLHPIVRDEVYRIATEAIRNAMRHAQARLIQVDIHYDDRHLQLRIRDNGTGIDAAVLDGHGVSGHWGLPGMRERAALIGGTLNVRSRLGSGTEVELSLPASKAYATAPGRRRS